MKGKSVFGFSRTMFVKSPLSLATVTVAALLLSIMIRNDPALAADLCPAPSFSAPRANDAGWKPVCLAIGDFNGDGKLDLAVGNYGAGTVSVLLGNGDGAFQAAVSSPGGSFPQSVVSSDFNGDGKLDLAVVNEGRPWNEYWGKVSVLLGNGNGSFQAGGNYSAGSHPQSIAVGDFNGDGKVDLAVANSGSTNISLLLGNGDGTFQPAVNYGAGSSPYSIAVGDFNGDGRADLAVANSGSTNISVLLGNGDGTFQPAVDYAAGASPYSVALGDFNGDGKLDLAVANFGNPYAVIPTVGTVSVLLGQGDGAFQAAVNYGVGLGPQFVLVGDFNGDGKLDMAVANNGRHPVNDTSGNVSVLLGNGDGTFRSSINYDAGWAPAFLAVGDFDGDGKPDLAINSMGPFDLELEGGPVEVLLNTCACAGIHLDVARSKNAATLSWPLPYSNFGLEATASVGSTNWHSGPGPPTTNNGRFEITVPLDQPERYFRLRRP